MSRHRLSPLDPAPSAADRTALRRPTQVAVVVSSSALGHLAAEATDLSLAGCRIALDCRLEPGQFVMLTFPTFAPLGGRVAWSTGPSSGIAFARPLARGVLDHLLARHGARGR